MPAWLWITVVAAVAFVFWTGWGRGWLHAWLYDWRHAQHVIELSRAEYDNPAPEYGSMILAEERRLRGHLAFYDADGQLELRDVVRGLRERLPDADTREHMFAELSPESLGGGPAVSHLEGADGVNAPSAQLDSGPGGSSLTPGPAHPAPPSRWLTEQLAILHTWSEWQQQKAAILS